VRQEFSAKTKAQAFERSGGHCEECTAKLYPGKIAYDHVIPDGLHGDNSLGNCAVLCVACHGKKTPGDVANIARAKRRQRRHIGIKRNSRPLAGSKASGLRKRMNGTVEKW
jgi:5-methylcytosine-specific restriction protein A